jgi:hypothetical protein
MNVRRTIAFATIVIMLSAALTGAASSQASPAFSPTPRGVLYAGLQDGSVYRSTDDGNTWQEADSGLPSGVALSALVVSPASGDLVYAGTSGYGVYMSTNGGATWQDGNGGDYTLQNATVVGLAIDPPNSSNVLALSSDGRLYYLGGDGTYDVTTKLPTSSQATALAVDPLDGNVLFAGTSDAGIYRSTDDGQSWRNTADGSLGTVFDLAVNPRNPSVAFATTAGGMYQTIDKGNSWQPERRGIPDGTDFTAVAVDLGNGATVVAGTIDGQIFRSVDGGTTWHLTSGAFMSGQGINTIFCDPSRSGSILAAVDGGTSLERSDDGGATWYDFSNPSPGAPVQSLAGISRPALPTDGVPAPLGNPAGVRYFPAARHTVRGTFLSFYNANNGLKIFGLPLTEAFTEGGRLVQYFERARLVGGGRVILTPLGSQVTAGRRFVSAPCCGTSGQMWFSSTRHTLAGVFLTFWKSHTGNGLFGAPISQPLYEQNGDGTGRTYLVQYFQNARMEYHPELAGTENAVTLGQLGRQVLQKRGWL